MKPPPFKVVIELEWPETVPGDDLSMRRFEREVKEIHRILDESFDRVREKVDEFVACARAARSR